MSVRSSSQKTPEIVVGWREWVSLPELGIPALKAKIDTGARTSALHAFELEAFRQNGVEYVRFSLHPLRKRQNLVFTCVAPVKDKRTVTDSGGHKESRYVIETPVHLGNEEWPIEMTLTSRDSMLFRMLLGRTAMQDRIVVDPGASYLTGRALAKTYQTKKEK